MSKKENKAYNSHKKTKILIVDDHFFVRKGLTQLINEESDFMVCAEAENADQALEAVDKQHIDLAVIDISLEGTTGIRLSEKIKSRCPNLAVLVLPTSEFLEK
jgi:two-component system invasion response regulator UvrY